MRCFAKFAVIALAITILAGCHKATVMDDWSSVVPDEVLAKASLAYQWQYHVRLDAGETLRQAWRLDDKLYALTSTNRLIALSAANGAYQWSVQVTEPHKRDVYAPCHSDNVMIPETAGIVILLNPPPPSAMKPFDATIINTNQHALLIDRATGAIKRKFDFPFDASSPVTADGAHLYVGAINGYYHCVRLADGLVQWTMSTGDVVSAAPKLAGFTLFVASQDGKFYAVNPRLTRDRHIWTQATDGPLTAGFSADSRGCYVPSRDYRLYAYEGVTGDELWAFPAQGPLRQDVQVGAKIVFQYADGDRLHAIDLATGRPRWALAEGRTVLAAIDANLLVLSDERRLLVVHESLGEVQMSLPMTGLSLFVPNASKPVVYAASPDGKVVCIGAAGAPRLTSEQLKD